MNSPNIQDKAFVNELQQFIETETQKQRFQVHVYELTDQCWDVCIGKPSARLDAKTENCLTNCVERFLDASNYIVNRLEKTSSMLSTGLNENIEFQ